MRTKPLIQMVAAMAVGVTALTGCQSPDDKAAKQPRRSIVKPYPLDKRGFTPVDKNLAKAEPVTEDDERSLNPYVLQVVSAYPTDGSYPYHADFKEPEYDIYNGVTQDMWYRGAVVAKAYPDGSRCSYCCGLTFEIFIRAMKIRNIRLGLDPDDFNGMSFHDLFNLLQLWYIEGQDDSPQRGIVAYGLGRAITDWEQARPGDFCDYSCTPPGGHSVIFINWLRNDAGKIVGFKYFSSNWGKGVGYAETRFSDVGGRVLRDSMRLARVGSVDNYRPFDRTQIPWRQAYAPNQP